MAFILPAIAVKLGLPLIAAGGKALAGAAGNVIAPAAGKALAGAAGNAAARAAARTLARAAGKAAAGGAGASRAFKVMETMVPRLIKGAAGAIGGKGVDPTSLAGNRALTRLRIENLIDDMLSDPRVFREVEGAYRAGSLAKWFFLNQYLPLMAERGILSKELGRLIMGDEYRRGTHSEGRSPATHGPWANYGYPDPRGFYMLDESGNVIGQGGDAPGPLGKWFGGLPGGARVAGAGPVAARPFGWAGQDFSDEMLGNFFKDPYAAWSRGAGGAGGAGGADGSDPFEERRRENEFLRNEKMKDFEFEQMTNDLMQDRIDSKLKAHYRKPAGQWAKELILNGLGRASQGAGEIFDAYNSALANSLMSAAASKVTRGQAELYGNSLMAPTAMYAGGRLARGNVANIAGNQLGSFLRDWSDRLAGEFAQQRALRIQMDMQPVGLFMENYYKLGRDIPGGRPYERR